MKQHKQDPPLWHSVGVVVRATKASLHKMGPWPKRCLQAWLQVRVDETVCPRVILTQSTNRHLVPCMRAIRVTEAKAQPRKVLNSAGHADRLVAGDEVAGSYSIELLGQVALSSAC